MSLSRLEIQVGQKPSVEEENSTGHGRLATCSVRQHSVPAGGAVNASEQATTRTALSVTPHSRLSEEDEERALESSRFDSAGQRRSKKGKSSSWESSRNSAVGQAEIGEFDSGVKNGSQSVSCEVIGVTLSARSLRTKIFVAASCVPRERTNGEQESLAGTRLREEQVGDQFLCCSLFYQIRSLA